MRYSMRISKDISYHKTYNIFQKNYFFPATINEWNMLDSDIQSSESLKCLQKQSFKSSLNSLTA